MAPKKELSIEKRASIIALYKVGLCIREIMKKENVSYGGVRKTISRYKDSGSVKNHSRSGRPRATGQSEDKFIIRTSKRDRFKTAQEIRTELTKFHNIEISNSTIKRRLCEQNLNGYVAAKKPLLRKQNKKKRLIWAKTHKDWNVEDWKKVLFSDESKFELFGSKRRKFVRRFAGERMKEYCVTPTVKHGGGSVMVWGCFAGHSVGDLIKIEGTMDKKVYHKILQHNAIPSGLRLVGKGFTFQEDNDPKHSSLFCRSYVQSKVSNNVLKYMTWPPQSPDCNPIELLWDHLDRSIRKTNITNRQQLWDELQKNWKKIPSETLQKLIGRMPRVCKAVIKARGGFFEESKI